MNVKILGTGQMYVWSGYLGRLPGDIQDIYSSPSYYKTFEDCGKGTAEAFVYEEDDHFVLYPYLRNPVNALNLVAADRAFFDIQGAYGYNGPLTNCPQEGFLRRFSEAFTDYCVQEKIIAEFTRFNPIIANHRWLPHAEISKANDVVNIDLSLPEEAIWAHSYDSDVRRIIKKAIDIGYRHRTVLLNDAADKDIEDFKVIYHSTLDRNRADPFYYFDDGFFSSLQQNTSKDIVLSIIYFQDQPIGASINPFLGRIGYGLLAGSLVQYRKISPFTFNIHRVAMKFKELGVKHYLLGGGNAPGDGIFKYKKSFCAHGVMDFFIGTRVHDQSIYDALCRAWLGKYPDKAARFGRYFLRYRY